MVQFDLFKHALSIGVHTSTFDILRYVGWPNIHYKYILGLSISEQNIKYKEWSDITDPILLHTKISYYMKPCITYYYKDKSATIVVSEIVYYLRHTTDKEWKLLTFDIIKLLKDKVTEYERSDYIHVLFLLEFKMYTEMKNLISKN
jgi:hypothetical protein